MKDLNFLRSFLFPTILLLLYFDALFFVILRSNYVHAPKLRIILGQIAFLC